MLTGKAVFDYYTFISVMNSVTYISLEVGGREAVFFIVGRELYWRFSINTIKWNIYKTGTLNSHINTLIYTKIY